MEYLNLWWNDALTPEMTWLGIPLHQVNKVAKIVLYSVGLLAIFEYVQFRVFMKQAKEAVVLIVLYRALTRAFLNLPNYLVRILVVLPLLFIRKESAKEHVKNSFKNHWIERRKIAEDESKSHGLVKILHSLERYPVSDRGIKIFIFIIAIIVAPIEILTG